MTKDLGNWLPAEGEATLKEFSEDMREPIRAGLNEQIPVILSRAQWGFVCGMIDNAAPRQQGADVDLAIAINRSIEQQASVPPLVK